MGGAAIAAYRLHEQLSKRSNIVSKMLVLVKTSKEETVFDVSIIDRNIARVGLYLDKLFAFRKRNDLGLFSTAPFGVKVSTSHLVKEADVLYLHWINNGFISLGEIEKILNLGKPIFFFCHDMWFFSGGCHQSFGCKKFEEICNDCHFFKSNILIDQARIGFNRKQKMYSNALNLNFIGPSRMWQQLANSSKLTPENTTHFISNILDEEKFKPLNGNIQTLPLNKYILLYGAMGGKSNQYKGWDFFVDAIKLLSNSIKEKIEIILFGYNFTEDELQELPFAATSVGSISSEDEMVKLYQRAHIYVFPSLQESFGQTLMEAMACGLPAVAFPVGAAEDLIMHKKNGYLAKYKDSGDLALGISYLIDEENYETFSQNARNKILQDFSANSIVNQHLHLIGTSLNMDIS